MKRIIAALFRSDREAEAALARLAAEGFGPEVTGLLHRADLLGKGRAREAGVLQEEANFVETATLGGLAGVVLGATAAGLPGVGLILAAGALAAAVTASGQQGMEGLFWDLARRLNLSDVRSRDLVEEIGAGGVLLTVEAEPAEAVRAAALLRESGAGEIFDFEPDEAQPGHVNLP